MHLGSYVSLEGSECITIFTSTSHDILLFLFPPFPPRPQASPDPMPASSQQHTPSCEGAQRRRHTVSPDLWSLVGSMSPEDAYLPRFIVYSKYLNGRRKSTTSIPFSNLPQVNPVPQTMRIHDPIGNFEIDIIYFI